MRPRSFGLTWMVLAVSAIAGCSSTTSTNGGWKNWMPFQSASKNPIGGPEPPSFTSKVGGAAKGIRGQFASMGSAVSSAYDKAKSAVTSSISKGEPGEKNDPTSLANMPNSIGPELWVTNGQYYESTGQFTRALDNYTKALEKEPNNLSALVSTARLYERQGQSERAIEFFERAITAKPNEGALYHDLAQSHQKQGNLPAAKDNLQKAIAIEPKNVRYHNSLAAVLVDNGQATDAVKQLEQVFTPAVANYNVAYLHFNRQNLPAAQQHLQTALQIDPNLQQARELLERIGGNQTVQSAINAYQVAGNVMQSAQGISAPFVNNGQVASPAFPSVPQNLGSIPPSLNTPLTR